jgi:type I restriction enzyme S subunit
LKPGDILLEKSGGGPDQPVGRVVFVTEAIPEKFVCSNFVQLVRPNSEQIESLLLFHIMWQWHAMNRTLEFQAQTTGIRNLRTPDYLEQEINLPPIPEQKRIVDLISSVDSYIEALQQQLESAKRSRNAVLFELLNASGDDWVHTVFDEIADWSSGKNLPKDRRSDDGLYPVIGANGEIGRTNDFIYDQPLVIVGRVGSCGETYLSEGKVWISDNALIASPKNSVSITFLYYLLKSFDFSQIISGTTQPLITQGKLKIQLVLLPPLIEQKRVIEIISTFDKAIEETELVLKEAKNLRSGLLSDLLSGEHEIPTSYDLFIGPA